MRNPRTSAPINFRNDGEDRYAFAKVQYAPTPRDVINLAVNWSRSRFNVPFDSSGGTVMDDHQRDANGFVNLGWHRGFGAGSEDGCALFVRLYRRAAALATSPAPRARRSSSSTLTRRRPRSAKIAARARCG